MLAIDRLISKPPHVFAGQVPDIFHIGGEETIQSNGCIVIFQSYRKKNFSHQLINLVSSITTRIPDFD
jgi:hypothetical protein